MDVKFYLQFALSPYNYCANNPIVFLDFRGERIYWGVSERYSEEILGELGYFTGLDLGVDPSGFLYLISENVVCGSEIAREKILEIIKKKEILEVYTDPRYKTHGEVGGTIVNLNPEEVMAWINGVQGGLDPLAVGWGITLLHETYHTKFGYSIGHEEETFGDIGKVEQTANEIRIQLGLPTRRSYGPLKVSIENVPTFRLIPFDKESYSMMNDLVNSYRTGQSVMLEDINKIKGEYIKY